MDILKSKFNFKSTKQLAIVALTIVATAVMMYVVYAAANRRNVSLSSPESNPGASSASCLLSLTLNRPTPTPSPTPKPGCNSSCTSSSQCGTGMTCYIPSGSTTGNCRNPSCVGNSNCLCSTVTPTPTPSLCSDFVVKTWKDWKDTNCNGCNQKVDSCDHDFSSTIGYTYTVKYSNGTTASGRVTSANSIVLNIPVNGYADVTLTQNTLNSGWYRLTASPITKRILYGQRGTFTNLICWSAMCGSTCTSNGNLDFFTTTNKTNCATPIPTSTSKPTPSPTPVCKNCQYQVDLFYGPVIQSFAGGVRYSTTNRLIAAKSDFTSYPGCKLAAVEPIPAPSVTLPDGCKNPIAKKYLVPGQGTSFFIFPEYIKYPGGYAYALIKNTTKNCTYNIGLASYKANGSNVSTQNLNDYSNVQLGPGETKELMVKVPMLNDAPNCHYDFEKPAIYLYPEKTTEVSVNVDVNGILTKSIPDYGNGWKVTAEPSGLIDNKYDYLFYEANVAEMEFPAEGWVVAKSDLNSWFDTNLPKLGLNAKEAAQFKEYWQTRLPENKYFEIKLMSKSYLDKNLGLNISPKPSTVIRLDFSFKGTDTLTSLPTPSVVTPVRTGFTVVEWGGAVIN